MEKNEKMADAILAGTQGTVPAIKVFSVGTSASGVSTRFQAGNSADDRRRIKGDEATGKFILMNPLARRVKKLTKPTIAIIDSRSGGSFRWKRAGECDLETRTEKPDHF